MKKIAWINLLVGVWLIMAPFALGYSAVSQAATGNDIVLGILLIAFAWWALAALLPPVGVGWFQVFCGIWLIAAPYLFAYHTGGAGAGNDLVCGIIAIVVGLIESRAIAQTPRAVA